MGTGQFARQIWSNVLCNRQLSSLKLAERAV
jgi:hypothetical protein